MSIGFYNKQSVYYKKKETHGGGRTRNLTIRSRARYPIAPRGQKLLSAFFYILKQILNKLL